MVCPYVRFRGVCLCGVHVHANSFFFFAPCAAIGTWSLNFDAGAIEA